MTLRGRLGGYVRAFVISRSARVIHLTIAQALMSSLFAVLSARWLGPADRGVVVLTTTLGSLLSLAGSLGLATGGRMLLSTSNPGYSLHTHHRRSIQLGLVHCLTTATVGFGLLWVSHGWAGLEAAVPFLVYCVMMLVAYMLREGLHGLGYHGVAISGDVYSAIIQVIGIGVLFAAHHVDLLPVLWLMAASMVFQVAVLVLFGARHSTTESAPSIKFWRLIKLSAPALAGVLLQAYILRGDRVILGALSNVEAVGVYGTASTLVGFMWLIPRALSQIAFREAGQGNLAAVARMRRFTWLATFAVAAGCAALAYPLIHIVLGPEYFHAVGLVWLLVAAGIPMSGYYLDAAVLNGMGDLRGPAVAAGIGAVAMTVFCFGLIPFLGSSGAAIGAGLGYTAMSVVANVMFRRRLASPAPIGEQSLVDYRAGETAVEERAEEGESHG